MIANEIPETLNATDLEEKVLKSPKKGSSLKTAEMAEIGVQTEAKLADSSTQTKRGKYIVLIIFNASTVFKM